MAGGKLKIQCVTMAKQAGFNEVGGKVVDELLICRDHVDDAKQLHEELGIISKDNDGEGGGIHEEKPVRELKNSILQNRLANPKKIYKNVTITVI